MGKKPNPSVAVAVAPAETRSWWREILREPLALGLAPIIVLRPWLDGVTYPTDNFYFVWAILVLSALWGVRVLFRGESIRLGTPILLLTGFLGVALVTSLGTIQFDATYRTLLMWSTHLALFIIVTNGLRSRIAIGIVLGAIVISLLAESVWGLIHFKYVLPFVRESILNNPGLLKMYFGATDLNPELVHRLQVNRAFGSLLFPNALAAFLIIGIPYAFAAGLHSLLVLRNDLREHRSVPQHGSRGEMLFAGMATWVIVVCVSYFLFSFIGSFEFRLPAGLERMAYLPVLVANDGALQLDSAAYTVLWIVFVLAIPLLAGIAAGRVTARYGLCVYGHAIRVWILPPLLLTQAGSLWLTYSRGGLLALILAVALTLALLFAHRLRIPRAAIAGLALAFVFASLGTAAQGPAETPPAPSEQGPVRPQPPQQSPEQQVANNPVTKEGVNLTARDLANPASFALRVTYWKTGLSMAKANFWTGVGLGNFGFAYPIYQQVGAGDVKAAHNDYLQALCETGIFGFLLFCGFWIYFVIWGARRILDEKDRYERWILAGLYAGVLAFLIHSIVDFNFFNPALVFFVFLLAGVFYARGSLGVPFPPKKPHHQILAVVMLVAVALVTGLSARVFLCDLVVGEWSFLNVGNHQKINALFDAGDFFFREVPAQQARKQLPMKDIVTVARLIPDQEVIRTFGTICVPAKGSPGGRRVIESGQPIPPNAFLVVTHPVVARKKAEEYVTHFLENLAWADVIFPHNPELAAYFIQWHDLLAATTTDADSRKQHTLEFLAWAEEGVKRAPYQALFHEFYAKALWLRGNTETSPGRRDFFEKGLEEYKRATQLYPSNATIWRRYAEALTKYGESLVTIDQKSMGEARIAAGREATEHADELERQRAAR